MFYWLHLAGGGGDLVCIDCLPGAREHYGADILLEERRDSRPGVYCAWCDAEADDLADSDA